MVIFGRLSGIRNGRSEGLPPSWQARHVFHSSRCQHTECFPGVSLMNIHIAESDQEISDCYPVMRELRPHIEAGEFLSRVRKQEESGYRLAYVSGPDGVVAVAGFRTGENLAWGRFLYIDDLVTLPSHRSKGIGSALFTWLEGFAGSEGCPELHLDSGFQRKGAHRFYERAGMPATGYHFAVKIRRNE